MKRIAVINDLSGLGKCSLTAAIPVISAMGVQACPMPTAVLSCQTGFPSYYMADCTPHMEAIMASWKSLRFAPDGIYTGFLGSSTQAEFILQFLLQFQTPQTTVLIDPVMGDRGETYDIFSEFFLQKMRTLVSHAQVITPNLTEALLLLYGESGMRRRMDALRLYTDITGKEITNREAFQQEIAQIGLSLQQATGVPILTITGIDFGTQVGTLLLEKGTAVWVFNKRIGGSYSGTGDLFASVLIAGLVQGFSAETCVRKAVSFLEKGIRDAVLEGRDRNEGICFETYLHEL